MALIPTVDHDAVGLGWANDISDGLTRTEVEWERLLQERILLHILREDVWTDYVNAGRREEAKDIREAMIRGGCSISALQSLLSNFRAQIR
jgi:hypothetical protein